MSLRPISTLYLRLNRLGGSKSANETLTLITDSVRTLDSQNLILAISLFIRFGLNCNIYVQDLSIGVYLYRRFHNDPTTLEILFRLLHLDLSLPAFLNHVSSPTLGEYLLARGVIYPIDSSSSKTLRILEDTLDAIIEPHSLEKYLLTAIRAFSFRSLSFLLKTGQHIQAITQIRMVIQTLQSLNEEALIHLIIDGVPILPLYSELIRQIEMEMAGESKEIRDVIGRIRKLCFIERKEIPQPLKPLTPDLNYLVSEFGIVPIQWMSSYGESPITEIVRSQRRFLRRLEILRETPVVPDFDTCLKALIEAGTVNGLAHSKVISLSDEVRHQLLEYLGLPPFPSLLVTNEIFITTLYWIIHQDPAYASNLFTAITLFDP